MTDNFMKDCPCNICIVLAICNESCLDEIIWYSKLSEENKTKFIEMGRYKDTMSLEAADFIAKDYKLLSII